MTGVLLALVGCEGPVQRPIAPSPRAARLSHVQWEATVVDLLHLDGPTGLSETFVHDPTGQFDNDAEVLVVSPVLWQQYQLAAESLAAQVVGDRALYAANVPQDPRSGGPFGGFAERIDLYTAASDGTFDAEFDVPVDGLYEATARVGHPEGPIVITVDGVGRTVAVEPGAESQDVRTGARLAAGVHELVVSTVGPLAVEWVSLDAVVDPLGPSSAGERERDEWIRTFGRRAFRRDLTEPELRAWTDLFDAGAPIVRSGDDFADGVRASLAGFLQSPAFLYRLEESVAFGPLGRVRLAPFEVASKVSYALWNSLPDDALLAAADRGLDGDTIAAEVDRMLDDPRAHGMIRDFHRQLLHLDAYENIDKAAKFTEFHRQTPAAMQAETYRFVEDVVFGGGGVRELLTSRRTEVDADLAAIYGIDGVSGSSMVSVDLDPTERAGLLTLPGFLASQADDRTENLIGRGAFVNLVVLCAELDPPPAGVPPLPPPVEGQTTRERVEAHTRGCGDGCHSELINPIGAAYQHYDALGRYRTEEGGQPVDASGEYTFLEGTRSFADAVELAEILGDSEQVHRCYVSHLLAYLNGRSVAPADEEQIRWLTDRSLVEHRAIRDLVADVVTGDGFRFRAP